MIKLLKLQRGFYFVFIGLAMLIVYSFIYKSYTETANYALIISGIFLIIGALSLIYPILIAKKNKDGVVDLTPSPSETKSEA